MNNFELKLAEFVPGGQVMADVLLSDGTVKKAFVWGGLPGEIAEVRVFKKRAGIFEAVAERVLTKSPNRVKPKDKTSYLSTSPWQILDWSAELHAKAKLTQAVFAQHQLKIALPEVVTDDKDYNYRNKMEFTWWWDNETNKLALAHYRRGAKGKIAVSGSSLALNEINLAARRVRNLLNDYQIEARQLKTLLVRANQAGEVVTQLYVTSQQFPRLTDEDFTRLKLSGFEIIYSNPKSPASVISERLQTFGKTALCDQLFDKTFTYPVESFFQINLPVYELALAEIAEKLDQSSPIVDMYSGVGTIGLSVARGRDVTLVEINEAATAEMQANVSNLGLKNAFVVLSPAELANEYITGEIQLILDPPRAGLHTAVIERILHVLPKRIIYLSCNPATQARDLALLSAKYQISDLKVFNFFPRTPHIESLATLDLR